MKIFENEFIYIQVQESQIPWLMIFTQKPYKELSYCDKKTKESLFDALEVIEKEMLKFYKPEKINIASFGNYVQRVHFHIMARFKNDCFFPESMWGIKQRDTNLNLPKMDEFVNIIKKVLV